jgi:hypothetical protein
MSREFFDCEMLEKGPEIQDLSNTSIKGPEFQDLSQNSNTDIVLSNTDDESTADLYTLAGTCTKIGFGLIYYFLKEIFIRVLQLLIITYKYY